MNTEAINIRIQIEQIKDKIEKAKKAIYQNNQLYYQDFYPQTDPYRHTFSFNSPLSSQKIDTWEKQYKTCLPIEYRIFLEEIGNGGGEVHGMEILPLEHWFRGLGFEDQDKGLIAPSQSCLLFEEYQNDEAWEKWLVEIAGENWEDKCDHEIWSPFFGTITICQDVCGPHGFLVLNGPLKGRIGFVVDWGPPIFESSLTFLDWYELWLDSLIRHLQKSG